jgi:protein-tyrosine phosphatase
MRKQVLFLCSGNYYRSRFAEHLFNWLASQSEIRWQADSRGLYVGKWGNIGPISRYTLRALKELGIPMNGQHRDPQPATMADFSDSHLVVAIKESEHRPVITSCFSEWADRIEYWDVDDLDCAGPEEALPYLEQKVRALVRQLGAADNHRGAAGPDA